jgi:hypothetical protein
MRSQDTPAKDLFSLSRAFARVWKTPEARRELGEGFFNLADKAGNLAERITELGPPASAIGDFGIAVAKGSPAVVAAGIVCPAWGLGLLAAVSAAPPRASERSATTSASAFGSACAARADGESAEEDVLDGCLYGSCCTGGSACRRCCCCYGDECPNCPARH